MGYWNGWTNFEEWAVWAEYTRQCAHCKNEFHPKSGNQKYCSREDNPSCDDDRYFEALWQKGKHPLQLTNQQ